MEVDVHQLSQPRLYSELLIRFIKNTFLGWNDCHNSLRNLLQPTDIIQVLNKISLFLCLNLVNNAMRCHSSNLILNPNPHQLTISVGHGRLHCVQCGG